MTKQAGRSILGAAIAGTVAVTLGLGAPAASADPGTEMVGINHGQPLADVATELIEELDSIGWPEESDYNLYSASGAPTTIVFGTPGQPTTYRNETQCATFVRRLMTHAFPTWATTTYFRDEFGGSSYPNSAAFHDAFAADRDGTDDVPGMRGFNLAFFPYLTLRPGDVMAIRYAGGGSGSGHMAIVGPGSHLYDDTHPDHREWAIRVLDSTNSPHGDPGEDPTHPDTRHYHDSVAGEWTEGNGAGMGWMFVRTSRADGRLVAHRWSSSSGTWYDQSTRSVVFGRVDPYA